MSSYPYRHTDIAWIRPQIDRSVLKELTKKSDALGLLHCLGSLLILAASGALCYALFLSQQWLLLAVALYVHGGIFAFRPQVHELSHNTVFKTKRLNRVFARVFGLVHWTSNHVRYWMSHRYHHRYTLHKASEAERVVPRVQTPQELLLSALLVVDISGFVVAVYDRLLTLLVPFERNPRKSAWERYVYAQATEGERRDACFTDLYQFLFHVAFGIVAALLGHWFLIVIVTLPHWYGARWYHRLVHDTMHVGREPESNDFRKSCRTVRVDPITSFLYWHMEWHTEHHTFAAVPCYNLGRFHRRTRRHWEKPQGLFEAWREINRASKRILAGAEGY
jgi:fatty acid desaturase